MKWEQKDHKFKGTLWSYYEFEAMPELPETLSKLMNALPSIYKRFTEASQCLLLTLLF